MEGLFVDHEQQDTTEYQSPRRLTWLQTGEGNGYGNHGGKADTETCENSS